MEPEQEGIPGVPDTGCRLSQDTYCQKHKKIEKEKKRFISESCKVCYSITYARFVKDMQQSFL